MNEPIIMSKSTNRIITILLCAIGTVVILASLLLSAAFAGPGMASVIVSRPATVYRPAPTVRPIPIKAKPPNSIKYPRVVPITPVHHYHNNWLPWLAMYVAVSNSSHAEPAPRKAPEKKCQPPMKCTL